jgi:hypothetical protein
LDDAEQIKPKPSRAASSSCHPGKQLPDHIDRFGDRVCLENQSSPNFLEERATFIAVVEKNDEFARFQGQSDF